MAQLTPKEAILQAQLSSLRTEADSVRQQIKISSASERQFYAKTYLWWRDARNESQFLANEYAQKGITFKATQNAINWRPLLKLVTDKMITKTDLDIWSRVFGAIHDDFDQDPDHYAHDPVGQIDYFIESRGGKTGVAGYHPKSDKGNEDETEQTKAAPDLFYDLDDEVLDEIFLGLARSHYSQSPAAPVSSPTHTEFSANGFGLALIRRGSPSNEYVKSTALSNIVSDVLTNCYRSDFEAAPLPLRCIIETLHIANVPLVISKSRDRFKEFSELHEETGDKKNSKTSRLLTYRRDAKDILLSTAHVRASLTVVATPKVTLVQNVVADLFLIPYLRRSVEVRLLHQRMFNAFSPSTAAFTHSTDGNVHRHFLSLPIKPEFIAFMKEHEITDQGIIRSIRSLRHDAISLIAAPHNSLPLSQPQFVNSRFTPTWKAIVSQDWLRRTVTAFFDEWIVEYGIKSMRPMNRVLSLYLDNSNLHVGYEFGKDMWFDNNKTLPMDAGVAHGSAHIILCSRDIAFTLRQICDLPITGPITLNANEDAIVASFETDACQYAIAIPSSDDNGVRRANCFAKYQIIQGPPTEDDTLDDGTERLDDEG